MTNINVWENDAHQDNFGVLKDKRMNVTLFQRLLAALVLIVVGLVMTVPASASLYSGGDWYGRDLTLTDGDQLTGNFLNIGVVTLPTGATVSGIGSLLRLEARQMNIDGNLLGNRNQPVQLFLDAARTITLGGTLQYWSSIDIFVGESFTSGDQAIIGTDGYLKLGGVDSATPLNLSGNISLVGSPNSGTLSIGGSGTIGYPDYYSSGVVGGVIHISPIGSVTLVDDSSLLVQQPATLLTTPAPAAALLFCSGLGGMALLRRRSGQLG